MVFDLWKRLHFPGRMHNWKMKTAFLAILAFLLVLVSFSETFADICCACYSPSGYPSYSCMSGNTCCPTLPCYCGSVGCGNCTNCNCGTTTLPTSLFQSAYPPSPQPQGTTVTFTCEYINASNNVRIPGADCKVWIDTSYYSTIETSDHKYTYSTSSLSVDTHNWNCSCSKSGYQSQTGSTESYTITSVDDPCDNSGTWRKYGIYCCEEDCSKDITKIRGFCLDKATYENNKDKLKLVKEGSNENCVSCTKEECCHELRSFCYDYSQASPTGCEGDAGIVTLKCSSAGGNTCDYKQNLGGCTLKESGSKLGLLYCANCQAPPPSSTTTTTTIPSTTTTTQPTTTTSTTTTTLPPMPVIQCQECYARSKCECSLTTPCNNGFWVLKNKEANPLSSIIMQEIPPTTIQFEPNASGKILITSICYKDSQVETNQYTLEVKEPFLECDEDCEVLKPCECYVRGCKDGSFTAVLGNNVLKWKEKITTTDFVTSFISDKPGVVDVSVQCYDPMIYAEKEVPLGGEIRPTRVFSASNFRSTSLQGSYRIKLDYSNRLEEDVIIILTLSKNGKATNKKYVAEPGDGTANYLIDCEEFSGTYSVSWKAFKSSDRQNPIVWSKPEEMVTLTC